MDVEEEEESDDEVVVNDGEDCVVRSPTGGTSVFCMSAYIPIASVNVMINVDPCSIIT